MVRHIQNITLALLLCLPGLSGAHVGGDSPATRSDRFMCGNALGGAFYENRGQIVDSEGKPRPEIRYYAFFQGAQVYFTPAGWHTVYSVFEEDERDIGEATGAPTRSARSPLSGRDDNTGLERRMRLYRMDMTLAGSNRDVGMEATGLRSRHLNYYLAHCADGITRVPAWSGLRYRNIYDNIDLVLYAAGEGMKYEFEIRPGGRVEDIHLLYDGTDGIEQHDDGTLRIRWPLGYTLEGRPFSYQEVAGGLKEVSSSYRVNGKQVRFDVGEHDPTCTLIIDPWSTFYGGSSSDLLRGLATDSSCAVLATGYTYSHDFPLHSAWQSAFPSPYGYTAYALKFQSSGNLSWATFMGGSRNQYGNSVTSDTAGNIIISGSTKSDDFPVYKGLQMSKATPISMSEGYLVKLDGDGVLIWATYFGGSNGGSGLGGVGTDGAGNIYACGIASGPNLLMLRSHQPVYAGATDLYFLKMTSDCKLIFSSYLGGSAEEMGPWLAVDTHGNFAVGGRTKSADFPILNAYQPNRASRWTNTVSVYDSSGVQLWSTYLGGSHNDELRGVSFDRSGNVFVGGKTWSSDFPVHNAVPTVQTGQSYNATISKFSFGGQMLWSTYFGGAQRADAVGGVVCDSTGNIYIAGQTSNLDFPLLSPAYPGRPNPHSATPNSDGFILKYDSTYALEWATCFGGDQSERCNAIVMDRRGVLYVGGETFSSDFPVYNAVQDTIAPIYESIYIHRFYTDGRVPVTLTRLAAQRVHGGVRLDWSSESEINVHGYVIERQHGENGVNDGRWRDVGFVVAIASGGKGSEYSYLDGDAGPGDVRIYYRLRMIDNDGSFEHSPVVEVAPERTAEVVGFEAVCPTPAMEWVTLRFSLPVEQAVTLIVHDITGREVTRVFDNHHLAAGTHSIAIPVQAWRSGLYLCTLTSGDATITRRALVVR